MASAGHKVISSRATCLWRRTRLKHSLQLWLPDVGGTASPQLLMPGAARGSSPCPFIKEHIPDLPWWQQAISRRSCCRHSFCDAFGMMCSCEMRLTGMGLEDACEVSVSLLSAFGTRSREPQFGHAGTQADFLPAKPL